MFEVVGCRDCGALWIREGEAKTATCPRCRRRFSVDRLRTLGSAESAELAREIRSDLLADRSEFGDVVAGYTDVEAERVIGDATYLEAMGIDPEEVTDTGTDREESLTSRSDREIVLRAIETIDNPSAQRIAEAVESDGVSGDAVEELLDRLRTAGELTFDGQEYRRV